MNRDKRKSKCASLENSYITDPDIFYDASDVLHYPDPVPSPNRSRPAQDDRDRDHPNLSNQPNTEAYAGRTQPSVGPNSDRHAKDNNSCYDDNNDHFDDNDDDEDQTEDETANGSTLGCKVPRHGVFVDYCDASCTRPQTAEEAKPTKFVSFCCSEGFDKQSIELVRMKKSLKTPKNDKMASGSEEESKQGLCEGQIKGDPVGAAGNVAQEGVSSARNPRTEGGAKTLEIPSRVPQKSTTLLAGDSGTTIILQKHDQASSKSIDSSEASNPQKNRETTSDLRSDERIVPLLENIYEVLQTLRSDNPHSASASGVASTPRFSIDSSAEPPREPIQSTPLIVHSVCGTALALDPVGLSSTDFCSSWSHSSESMALLEPPEREMETLGDTKSTSKALRLVPVDIDLFRVEDWDIQELVEENPVQDELSTAAAEAEGFESTMPDAKLNTAQFLRCEEESQASVSNHSPQDSKTELPAAQKPSTAQFLISPAEAEMEVDKILPSIKSDIGTDTSDLLEEPCSCSGSCANHKIKTADLENTHTGRVNLKRSNISPTQSRWREATAGLSFPATIETVQGLGPNSLFVKWKCHNLKHIAGYEIFVDGILTNRYFSRIHRAAVICNVDLECPHRIILCALPQPTINSSPSSKSSITSTPASGTFCPKINGIIWYPSVYHFEPTLSPAPVFFDFNGCCASKS